MTTATTMAPVNRASAYDGIGWFYDRYWRGLCEKAMPVIDRLVLRALPRGAKILDLCCGTGHLASALTRRGFRVTGLDGSEQMLRFARANAPRAQFVMADARRFQLATRVDAAVSTFDSMNHLLTIEDLAITFANVFHVLAPGGVFVFDLNMAGAFKTEWRKSSTVAEADNLCYVRGRYDRKQRLGTTEITTFRLNGDWTRQDTTIYQRCYSTREIRIALARAGFAHVRAHAATSLGIRGRLAVGRTYFVAHR